MDMSCRERDEEDRRRDQILRAKLSASLGESDRAETVPFDESTLEEIRIEGRKRLLDERNNKPV
jgi:hypothetical protein